MAFEALAISKLTKEALAKEFGYKLMSDSQQLYMATALSGVDVFVKARTGTGKTLGFLIPTLEAVFKYSGEYPIKALILSPSRELAQQTADEATRLLRFNKGYAIQLVTGGKKVTVANASKRLLHGKCDILVATPGRLQDHIDNLPGFTDALEGVQVVVLDEADRLLDAGFRPAIVKILSALGHSPRQTMLFTATVPAGVEAIAKEFMRPNFEYIDTVGEDANNMLKIVQEYVVLPIPRLGPALFDAVLAHRRVAGHKIIVFFNTAWMAHFMTALFHAAGMTDVLETHSRLSQGKRNAVAKKFADSSNLVLFASDVVARGLDFPDVTLVIQYGLTDASQYEHRVGRTGRAGKTGLGLLIIAEDKKNMLALLAALQVKSAATRSPAKSPDTRFSGATSLVMRSEDLLSKANRAFVASLGFYASNMKVLGWKAHVLVDNVMARFASLGLTAPTAIDENRLKKMHLAGVRFAPTSRRAATRSRGV